MTDNMRDRDLDRTDRLFEETALDDLPATEQLAELLAAAATPDYDRALAGEDAMLAEYRAAAPETIGPSRARRPVRVALGVALAAFSLYGIASAAPHARPPAPELHQPPAPSAVSTNTEPPASTSTSETTPQPSLWCPATSRPDPAPTRTGTQAHPTGHAADAPGHTTTKKLHENQNNPPNKSVAGSLRSTKAVTHH